MRKWDVFYRYKVIHGTAMGRRRIEAESADIAAAKVSRKVGQRLVDLGPVRAYKEPGEEWEPTVYDIVSIKDAPGYDDYLVVKVEDGMVHLTDLGGNPAPELVPVEELAVVVAHGDFSGLHPCG